MPKIGRNYRRWRWIPDQVKQQGCKVIPDLDCLNRNEVPNKQVLKVILTHSPKLQTLRSNLAEHTILRDEKMLVWFLYPVVQELVLEILINHGYLKDPTESLRSGVQQKDRNKMQNDINDPASSLRVLLVAMNGGGVGLDFQEDSHISMLFQSPKNLDMELRIIGWQHRLGQLLAVLVYSVVIISRFRMMCFWRANKVKRYFAAASSSGSLYGFVSSVQPQLLTPYGWITCCLPSFPHTGDV